MKRYWVLLDENWQVTAVEDKGNPLHNGRVSVCEPGPFGEHLFDVGDETIHDIALLRGTPFDIVLDATDELSAFAVATTAVTKWLEEYSQ